MDLLHIVEVEGLNGIVLQSVEQLEYSLCLQYLRKEPVRFLISGKIATERTCVWHFSPKPLEYSLVGSLQEKATQRTCTSPATYMSRFQIPACNFTDNRLLYALEARELLLGP